MEICLACQGTGKSYREGWGGELQIIKCQKCDGLGAIIVNDGIKKCLNNLLDRIEKLEEQIERK